MGTSAVDEVLVSAVRAMAEASEAYKEVLGANAERLREFARRLEAGEDVVAITRAVPGAPSRSGAKDASQVLNEARLQFRARFVNACTEGGMSRKELAANMGMSPQIISRYLAAGHSQE